MSAVVQKAGSGTCCRVTSYSMKVKKVTDNPCAHWKVICINSVLAESIPSIVDAFKSDLSLLRLVELCNSAHKTPVLVSYVHAMISTYHDCIWGGNHANSGPGTDGYVSSAW